MKNRILGILFLVLILVLIVAPDIGSQGGQTLGLELTNYLTQVQTFNKGIALGPLFTLAAPPEVVSYNLVLPSSAAQSGFYLCVGSTPGTWAYCGVGGTPSISIAPTSLSFGAVQTSHTSNLPIVITNTGNALMTFSGITLSGSATFTKATTCGTTLDSGATCGVTITFAPVAVTNYTGTLSIADNVAGSPQTVALTGSGAGAQGSTSALVTWVASNSGSIQGYNVYRGTRSGGPYTKLNNTILPSLMYTDSAVSSGTTYCYVITAYSNTYSIPESTFSSETCVAIP
jgi:hypothetical protein